MTEYRGRHAPPAWTDATDETALPAFSVAMTVRANQIEAARLQAQPRQRTDGVRALRQQDGMAASHTNPLSGTPQRLAGGSLPSHKATRLVLVGGSLYLTVAPAPQRTEGPTRHAADTAPPAGSRHAALTRAAAPARAAPAPGRAPYRAARPPLAARTVPALFVPVLVLDVP